MNKTKLLISIAIGFSLGLLALAFTIIEMFLLQVHQTEQLTLHKQRQELLVQASEICQNDTIEFTVTNEYMKAKCL